jgi:hypothetical protein
MHDCQRLYFGQRRKSDSSAFEPTQFNRSTAKVDDYDV